MVIKPKDSCSKTQKGLATVEFTIIATAMLIIFFGIFEIGRYVYSIQMLNEATRRAARLASVCYVDNNTNIPAMNTITSLLPSGFSKSSLDVEYLDNSNSKIADPVTNFTDISFVRARIDTSNTSYTFFNVLTHFTGKSSVIPEFETTLPAESLGVIPTAASSSTHTNCS